VRNEFDELPATEGWPGRAQFRFTGAGVRLMLWSAPDQCDWWISGEDDAVRRAAQRLIHLSDLGASLWSDDPGGEALVRSVRGG
jgi:hypothetical protein